MTTALVVVVILLLACRKEIKRGFADLMHWFWYTKGLRHTRNYRYEKALRCFRNASRW